MTALNTTRSTGILPSTFFLLEHFQDMPGDRLALAVGVGGQDQLVGALHGGGDVLDLGLGAGVDVPDHGEIVVRLHRAVLGGQVADMAEAGQDFVAGAQILIDGLGFGGGLDDEDVHPGFDFLGFLGAYLGASEPWDKAGARNRALRKWGGH